MTHVDSITEFRIDSIRGRVMVEELDPQPLYRNHHHLYR
jgi:hypothetical protein